MRSLSPIYLAGNAGRDTYFGRQDFVKALFTGQERDQETNLDFFKARYFSAAQGRFNSPDPGNAGADLFNPQRWNAYAYVNSNPLALVDPSGMDPFGPGDPGDPGNCWDDPFCNGSDWPIFPLPIGDQQPQNPAPPPIPTPATIQNTTGVYSQGQWGSLSFSDQTTSNGNGSFFNVNLMNMDFGLVWGLLHWAIDYHGHIPLPPNLSGQPGSALRYCGPGAAGGPPVNQADKICQAHDECYARAGLAWYNMIAPTLAPSQRKAKRTCDAQLCAGVNTTVPNDRRESGDIFLVGATFGCAP